MSDTNDGRKRLRMEHEEEADIAEGLLAGRTDAWLRLYDRFAERIWRSVARSAAPDDVPDVVQETFLAAARSARNYDPARGSLGSWLSGIARRQVALHYRKQARQPVAMGDDSAISAESGTDPGPAEMAEGTELAQQVRSALTQLPADYEVLLTAKYIYGERVAEIARNEAMTEEAVRSKLARARRAFRKQFEKK